MRDVKETAWRAYLAGNLNGGDPNAHGVIEPEIMKSIRVAFRNWWRLNKPPG